MTKKTPEGYVKSAVMDYLAVKRIFALRMNSGQLQDRRGIPVKMHERGTADILAFPAQSNGWDNIITPTWIETKAPNGKQSELQKSFQQKVESEGHVYILCYGLDDLERAGL